MLARIRPATPADGPGIAYARVTTWRAAYRGIVPQAYLDGMSIEADSARFSEGLAHLDPQRCVYVAEVDGPGGAQGPSPVAGFCMGGPNREEDADYTAELYAIYLLPEYQGQGLGRGLFKAVTGWLAEHGHRSMILYVLRDNAPSRRFYEALGGCPAREQMIEIGGAMLVEIGYGYNLLPPQDESPQ